MLYPAGAHHLFERIERLVAWRKAGVEQAWRDKRKAGSPPPVNSWEVSPGSKAGDWRRANISRLLRHHQPYYLLILGDFDGIDLDFQHRLSADHLVGRLCLPEPDDYAAYAAKLVAAEQAARAASGRLLLYSSAGARPDRAVDDGLAAAIRPLAARARDPGRSMAVTPDDVLLMGPKTDAGPRDWAEVRARLGQAAPSVLFNITHGEGSASWSREERRALQGRTVLPGGERIDEVDLAARPFLPGGVWFNMACFGGGTPQHSRFDPWLRRLASTHRSPARARIPDVRGTQSSDGAFVARQPQLALANPHGPLAVIAHADIAFTYSYRARGEDDARLEVELGPIEGVLTSLLAGSPAGVAFRHLSSAGAEVGARLLRRYDAAAGQDDAALRLVLDAWEARRGLVEGEPIADVYAAIDELLEHHSSASLTLDVIAEFLGWSKVHLVQVVGAARDDLLQRDLAERATDWLAHHDLAGWLLLGDPAARLAVGEVPQRPSAEPPPPPHSPAPAPDPSLSVDALERAVIDFIVARQPGGVLSTGEVAAAHGLTVAQLRDLHERYTAAGRAALEQGDGRRDR